MAEVDNVVAAVAADADGVGGKLSLRLALASAVDMAAADVAAEELEKSDAVAVGGAAVAVVAEVAEVAEVAVAVVEAAVAVVAEAVEAVVA